MNSFVWVHTGLIKVNKNKQLERINIELQKQSLQAVHILRIKTKRFSLRRWS
jgi:hypothetical protein